MKQELTDMRTASIRTFDTGATRSPLSDKLFYSRFMDSLVIKRYCEYLQKHRVQTDGNVREPDNWKQGIPTDSYMGSMHRHFMDVWLHSQGHAREMSEDIETALCALLFNVQGMLFELLRGGDGSGNTEQDSASAGH